MSTATNASSALHEFAAKLCLQISYEKISSSGPPHNPVFVYKVVVGDVLEEGTGKSIKEAKREAAAAALNTFTARGQFTPRDVVGKTFLKKTEPEREPTEQEMAEFSKKAAKAMLQLKHLYMENGPMKKTSKVEFSEWHEGLSKNLDKRVKRQVLNYINSLLDIDDPVLKVEKILNTLNLTYIWTPVPVKPIIHGKSMTYLHISNCDPPICINSLPAVNSKTAAAEEALEYLKDMLM